MRRHLGICALIAAALSAGDLSSQTATPVAGIATPPVQRFDAPLPQAPSPRNASYDIDVTLDHERRTLRGRQTLRWRNISSRPATELQFHLYWNAWRDRDSTWMRERRRLDTYVPPRDDAWGSIDVAVMRLRQPDGTHVDLTPGMRYLAPDDGNTADRTVIAVPAPTAVAPEASVVLDIEWTARIPRPFARTGYIGDYYFIGHWFPKIGVLEDGGWNTHQFHAATEFYADFGVYDVRITAPREFVVAASGRETARADNGDGTTTHRYRAEDVHDFAWAASPRFVESRRTIAGVETRLLLQPEQAGQQERHFAATAAALRLFGEWFGRYPYDHLTVVGPAYQSQSSGMEYPTLFTSRTRWLAPRLVATPEGTVIHETGHQFWQGVVATNEFEHAWMDEGMTQFAEARALEAAGIPNFLELRFFGGFIPWVVRDIERQRATDDNRLTTYRVAPGGDVPATPTFRYWGPTASPQIYDKPALWLHTLERHLGWPILQRILSTYFERWKFRHPTPEHFFEIAEDVSGRDLTWFFDQVYRSSNTFDYAAQALFSERTAVGRHRTTVVAQRVGEATFPVDVVTTFEDGGQARERWDGVERRRVYVYERPSAGVTLQVDPDRVLLLDVNYTNNSRTAAPRSGEASLKWSLAWMVWLQDLMLTYAFFV